MKILLPQKCGPTEFFDFISVGQQFCGKKYRKKFTVKKGLIGVI